MPVEIKRADSLSESEVQHLFAWGEDIFGSNSYNLTWRYKDVHFLLHEDDKLASHVGVLKHTVLVGETPVTVAGVGSVVTLPAAQKKGYAKKLMLHVTDFFRHEWQVAAGLLFCLPHMISFYESLGWQLVNEPVLIEQPDGEIESPLQVMILPCTANGWSNKKISLKSLPW